MITTSASKEHDAKRLGAHDVLLSTDAASMQKHLNTFDLIINTIPHSHDINPYVALLKLDGAIVVVGALELPQLIFKRRTLAGSVIGGIKQTQEMLDFCGKHNIVADVEMIKMAEISEAYERMIKNDVKYRFVIDMSTI